ncbi:MAG: type II secretory pathway pseudopilin PulG [Candidatus Paceibacteria bacterium]|jgi:type II secretory pathway pseudopilin PulG
MKKTILMIIGILVIGGGVYAYMQTQTQTENQDIQSTAKTINLMGIEMTEQQAKDHCKVMPNMAGCAEYLN